MEIWLDTIDEAVIADGVKTGLVSGVTTNPSILAHAADVLQTLRNLLDIQSGPVAVQVTVAEPERMVEEGRRIFAISPRMIVKVPVNRQGLIAIKQLRAEKIPVLGTGVLYPAQALLASHVGVAYIAPYFSHMSALGDAVAEIQTMANILRNSSTKILAASLKQVDQIIAMALLGVQAVTIKPDLYHKLLEDHPLVEGFSQKFSLDWMQKQAHRNPYGIPEKP